MEKHKVGYIRYDSVKDRYNSYLKNCRLSEGSKELLEEWMNERKSNKFRDVNNIGLLGTIINIAQECNLDLPKVDNKKVLQDFFNNNSFKDSQELWYKKCLKRFYIWLSRFKEEPRYLTNIDWIDTRQLSSRCQETAKKRREDSLISPKEVREMISKAMLLRDKLAISLLADTGIRAESIGASRNRRSINVGQVKIMEGYAIIKDIEEKFSKKRNVIVTEALSYLIKYWNELPEDHKENPKNPLFISYSTNRQGNRWGYTGLKDMLQKIGLQVINRKVNPHDFRHMKATRLEADDRLSDDSKCKLMGWSSRRMLDRYSHTTFDMAKDEYLQKKGILKVDDKKKRIEKAILKPKECLVCRNINSLTDEYCEKCGNSLQYEEMIKNFTNNRDLERKMYEFLKPEAIEKLFKTLQVLQMDIEKLKSDREGKSE